MRVPSYDDLTPSIPDIHPGQMLVSVAPLLPASGPVAVRRGGGAVSPVHGLFAALHGPAIEPLVAIARDFSPRVERRPAGTVVLDVAGLQRLLGEPAAIAADLSRAGAPRVAIATSHTAATLLARTCPGMTASTGDPGGALQAVPIAALADFVSDAPSARAESRAARATPARAGTRPPKWLEILRGWGLTTLGELAALPGDGLAARLGAEGIALQRLARGIDPRPLVPDPEIPRFQAAFELEWPVDTLEPLSFVLARLLDPLTAALARADRGAVALHLALRLIDRTSHARMLQLPAPLGDPRVLRTLLLLDLESHPPGAAIDRVSLEIDPAPARIVQYSLLERALPSPDTLATLMARLGALVGERRCGSPTLLDSHRPDAWVMGALRGADLPRPQPAAGDRAQPAVVLRRFRPPVAIRVVTEHGRPVRVAIDRRGMPGGIVRRAAGPWRTSGGWWDPGRWNRDEWDVGLSDGTVCRLFRDRDGGGWFLEGVVD